MKASLVLLLLGLLAVNSAYGLKCVIYDGCYDEIPDAIECTGEPGDLPTTSTPSTPTITPTTTPTTTLTTTPTTSTATTPTTSTATTPTTSTATPTGPSYRQRRSANKYLCENDYKCFTFGYPSANGNVVKKRGCTKKTCDELKTEYGEANVKNCEVCTTDGCNPASNMKSWALSSVILVAIVKMFL